MEYKSYKCRIISKSTLLQSFRLAKMDAVYGSFKVNIILLPISNFNKCDAQTSSVFFSLFTFTCDRFEYMGAHLISESILKVVLPQCIPYMADIFG